MYGGDSSQLLLTELPTYLPRSHRQCGIYHISMLSVYTNKKKDGVVKKKKKKKNKRKIKIPNLISNQIPSHPV